MSQQLDIEYGWNTYFRGNALSKKWQDRLAAFELFASMVLQQWQDFYGSTSVFFDDLQKVVCSERNARVAAASLRALAGFCRGLGNEFEKYIPTFWPHLLNRSKDPSEHIQSAIGPCLDAIAASATDSSLLVPGLLVQFSHPSPRGKRTLVAFVGRFLKTFTEPPTEFLDAVLPHIVECAKYPRNGELREEASVVLGYAKKLLGLDVEIEAYLSAKTALEHTDDANTTGSTSEASFETGLESDAVSTASAKTESMRRTRNILGSSAAREGMPRRQPMNATSTRPSAEFPVNYNITNSHVEIHHHHHYHN